MLENSPTRVDAGQRDGSAYLHSLHVWETWRRRVHLLSDNSTKACTFHYNVWLCLATYFHYLGSNMLSFSIAVRPDHELLGFSCFR